MNLNIKVHNYSKSRTWVFLGLYLLLMIIAAIVFMRYINQDNLQEVVKTTGVIGILVYFLIEVLYVTFTPLFNTAILITSGYIFGGHLGFIINFLATSLGLFLIVILVKRYGRPWLQKVVSHNFYNRFDKITQKVGPITLLIVYILPFTPDDELTYIVAAGPIGFKRFILPILLGTLAKAAYSYVGDMGAKGITIAAYARIALLIVGLVIVGIQEYWIKKWQSVKISN
ncbi:MAG TPA: VTT domain-containing protein [Candidatus Nanoarchaeia archaeon]|nr:VTT domain-containing protein [Candidatus Nanoarchaeia archaeon]